MKRSIDSLKTRRYRADRRRQWDDHRKTAAWAAVYVMLGALPDGKAAMLYSLEAMTTYGHAQIALESNWRMMGAMQALNGLILFGLTTAFLLAVIQGATQIGGKSPG